MSLYPDAIQRAVACIGRPYQFGAKWPIAPLGPVIPIGPVDCSGFSRWVLAQAGIEIPDGSYDQIGVCAKLPEDQQDNPPALSLGFFMPLPWGAGEIVPDHVIVSTGTGVVVEARGEPYNAVILRPVAVWLAQNGFLGFYAPPAPSV